MQQEVQKDSSVKPEATEQPKNADSMSKPDIKVENQTSPAAAEANPELEAYKKLRKTLHELVVKKNSIDRYLEEIEEKLYEEEGLYLQETNAGNIAKGFDQYTKTTQHRRKSVLTDDDRIFSQSSTSFDAEY